MLFFVFLQIAIVRNSFPGIATAVESLGQRLPQSSEVCASVKTAY